MADLDDFFAKKDRKKSKGKKFPTTDEIAKKLEDTKQKPDMRPKKDRPAQEGDESGRAGEEEEWKEYEEPVKDYTGLKIQVLQGGTGQPDFGKDSASDDATSVEGGKNKGPWNKPQQQQAAPAAPPPPVEEPPQKTSSAYVPPSRLRQQVEPVRRTQHKHLPDIHNKEYFPSLGAGKPRTGGGWAPASGGAAPAIAHPAPLQLGNSFTQLQDDS